MALLSIRDLSIQYDSVAGPVYAVNRVSLDMEDGETVGIVGESACGKSTLGLGIMRTLSGGRITGGSITLDGRSYDTISDREFDQKYRWKTVSMIFQGAMSSLDPVYTVREQFAEVLGQHGGEQSVISEAISSVNLDESVLRRYPHELSGGMKQRVIIALALLLRPKLVIADEPTTALDVLIQARIINMLKRLKESGMSFLFITHDLALLSEMADRVGIMYGGQLVEFGTAEQIYGDPQHPYTQGLLESIPRMRGSRPKYIRGTPPGLLQPPSGCRFADRCPHLMDICSRDPPDVGGPDNMVKCWLYGEDAPGPGPGTAPVP